MKKIILIVTTVIIALFTSCKTEIDPFLISIHNIGVLNDSTQIKDLKTLFINDSIVKYIRGDEFIGSVNDIRIYEKGGKQLLILTPSQALDSTSTIKSIRVVDNRFKTDKGLNSMSTFKTIKDNYKISSIQNTIRSLIVSVNEINAFFIIDKNELPENMRHNMNLKIETLQIPDTAKIKNFYLLWAGK